MTKSKIIAFLLTGYSNSNNDDDCEHQTVIKYKFYNLIKRFVCPKHYLNLQLVGDIFRINKVETGMMVLKNFTTVLIFFLYLNKFAYILL